MKKIYWLHSHFLYWMGGTKFIFEVISNLKKSKKISNITVVVEDCSEDVKSKYEELGVKIYNLNSITSNNALYWIFLPFFLIRNYFRLKKIIGSDNKEKTVLISSMFPMNVLANLFSYKHIQNCYEPFAFFYDQEFIEKFPFFKRIFIRIISSFYKPLDIFFTKKSTYILTLNSITKNLIKEIYDRESLLTQAGVNTNIFKPFVSKKISELYKNKKIIIHSTDYSPVKGTDRVIKSIPLIKKHVPNCLLLITSTINDQKEKQKLIEITKQLNVYENVKFLDFLSIEDLPQYYSLATVLVQGSSSLKSGTTSMALPVKEALACGTTVIRPIAGSEDIINNVTGFIVDPRNTKKLAISIIYLLKNQKIARKMGLLGKKIILNNYKWTKTAEVFEKLI